MAKMASHAVKPLFYLLVTISFVFLNWVVLNPAHAQESIIKMSGLVDGSEPNRIEISSARDRNTRLWEVTKWQETINPETNEPKLVQIKSYIREKGCGICYRDTAGNWQATDTGWRRTPDGFVMDKANYALEIGNTAESILTYHIDGKQMKLHPTLISIDDGNSIVDYARINPLVSGVIDAKRPNLLIFPDAFGKGIDLQYSVEPDGYHQNIVFKEKLSFTKSIQDCKILVHTEIDTDSYAKSSADQVTIELGDNCDKSDSGIQKIAPQSLTATASSKKDIKFVLTDSKGEHFISHRFTNSEIFLSNIANVLSPLPQHRTSPSMKGWMRERPPIIFSAG